MRKTIPLIPIGILLTITGITFLFTPFMYVGDAEYGGYFGPMTSLAHQSYWGAQYIFAPIMMTVFSIILIFIYLLIGVFSVLSVFKKKLSIVVLIAVGGALLFDLFNVITEIVTLTLSTLPTVNLMYIAPLINYPLFIALIIFLIINLAKSKQEPQLEQKKEQKSSSPSSQADEIMKWKKLLDDGAITKEEYEDKKREILSK